MGKQGARQTVGHAIGDDEARRARNVAQISAGLDEMIRLGAVIRVEHRTEPHRSGDGRTADLWDLLFVGDDHDWTYSYVSCRALLRGWRLGRQSR